MARAQASQLLLAAEPLQVGEPLLLELTLLLSQSFCFRGDQRELLSMLLIELGQPLLVLAVAASVVGLTLGPECSLVVFVLASSFAVCGLLQRAAEPTTRTTHQVGVGSAPDPAALLGRFSGVNQCATVVDVQTARREPGAHALLR